MKPGSPFPPGFSFGPSLGNILSRRLAAGIALCLAGALLLWLSPLFLSRFELLAQDALCLRTPAPQAHGPPPRVALILLGERSLARIHQWPWPRHLHVALLERLKNARLVVFDITMPERSEPESDRAFAEAVRRNGKVLMALYAAPRFGPEDTAHAEGSGLRLVYPYRELFDAALGFGVVNVKPDIDGIVRSTPMIWNASGLNMPSLALAAPVHLGFEPRFVPREAAYLLTWEKKAREPQTAIDPPPAVSLNNEYAARFYPARPEAIPVVEYADVLDGAVPETFFTDAVVVVGVSAAGASDLHRMPGGAFVPGSVLVAGAIAGFWRGAVLEDAPAPPVMAAALLLCALIAWASLRMDIRRSALLAFGLLSAWTAAWALLLTRTGLVMPLASPLFAGAALLSAGTCWSLFFLQREWAVRSLPMDTILLLPSARPSLSGALPEHGDFADHLEAVWPKIRSMCGFTLIGARIPADHEAVAPYRGLAPAQGRDAAGLLLIPDAADAPPRHRMILPLPFSGVGEEYTVIGFNGYPRLEPLKSAAALVLSLAAHYAAVEEQAKKQALLFATIRAITGAVDAKDPITAGHSERVALLARSLALWLGYGEAEAEEVYFAGILHDVGKIGVPDQVLGKEGKLSDEEFAAMKRHPAVGENIVKPIMLPPGVEAGILQHHERPDGRGYPHGLREGDISDTAKILKIADVYDALVSERQYKKAWPAAKALDLLYAQRGVEFDARMVEVFAAHMAPADWVPESREP